MARRPLGVLREIALREKHAEERMSRRRLFWHYFWFMLTERLEIERHEKVGFWELLKRRLARRWNVMRMEDMIAEFKEFLEWAGYWESKDWKMWYHLLEKSLYDRNLKFRLHISRDMLFRYFVWSFTRKLQHYYETKARWLLWTVTMIEWAVRYKDNRAVFFFITKNEEGALRVYVESLKYKAVLDYVDREMWYLVASELMKVAEGKRVDIMKLTPPARSFLRLLIGFYMDRPCRHSTIDIKITPFTFPALVGGWGTGFAITWAYKNHIGTDATVRRTRPIDFRVAVDIKRKPRHGVYVGKTDVFDADYFTSETRTAYHKTIDGKRVMEFPAWFAMLRPDLVKMFGSMRLGAPEARNDVDHCSVFFVPSRFGRRVKMSRERYMRREISKHLKKYALTGFEPWWYSRIYAMPWYDDDIIEERREW